MSIKTTIFNHLKNIPGWRTKRKLVVISVDDYGNVRLDSKKAREEMDKAGLKVHSRFDAYDALETREDLEALFDVLTSVKDKNGNNAVFTPFALPCNINFEKMSEEGYERYLYELLPDTYKKLSEQQSRAYDGTWKLWKEGIENGLMRPQFHGREHLNLKVFKEKLNQRDYELLTSLEYRSYASISSTGYSTIRFPAAFEFWNKEENYTFEEIIMDGLIQFKNVFGYKSRHFNPPGGRESILIHQCLKNGGIEFLDTTLIKNEHVDKGKFIKVFNYTGKKNEIGMPYQVRNVVFEPCENNGIDWVNYSLAQIEAAFFWSRPAIISSHRVNFCGHIDPNYRKKGLKSLELLLKSIINKWPDVEFISSEQLGDLILMK